MNQVGELSRRTFLTAGAAAVALRVKNLGADEPGGKRFPLIAFSKPFQKLSAEKTAEVVAEVGWDGIEIPVRKGGQVAAERAADELPKFAEALRAKGRDIYIVTTDIKSIDQPHAMDVLRATSALGIKRIRLGFWSYDDKKEIQPQLDEIKAKLKDIAAACRELKIQAGFQNHSGSRFVGAPIWDIYQLIHDIDRDHLGVCFDIGHATIEGGLSWPVEARLMAPFFTAIYVKDFVWKKVGDVWKQTWCPLGEGMVNREFFDWLKKTDYRGPISQHHEYDHGEGAAMIAKFKKDLNVLKGWVG